MKNILKFIDTWGSRIVFFLVLIVFLKTCTTNTKIERVEDNLSVKVKKLDSLIKISNNKPTITKEEMIFLLKNTPNWKTLELEELSDKNRIPINKLKNDEEKD